MKTNDLVISKPLRTAVILAAGIGSRISELTETIPKTMIEVDGVCIYEHILNSLLESGIDNIVVVVGYRSSSLTPLIKDYANKNNMSLTIVENKRYLATNTMYSLWLARAYLKDSFLFVHADLIFSTKMLKLFLDFPHENSVLVDTTQPHDWNDAMKVIENNNVLSYMSKCITVNEMDGVAIGMYKFNKHGANIIFETISQLVNKGVVKSWVSEAINIASKKMDIYIDKSELHAWIDVDNLHDLGMAHTVRENMELE